MISASCRKRFDSPTSTIDQQLLLKSDSRSSLKTSSCPRPPGHRRQRTRIDSTEIYKEVVLSSNQKRQQRHNAFCAKDFQEKILTELYPYFCLLLRKLHNFALCKGYMNVALQPIALITKVDIRSLADPTMTASSCVLACHPVLSKVTRWGFR
jgi:hypothetical protein